jgi:uncharacterized protein YggT (Ycf19 family)
MLRRSGSDPLFVLDSICGFLTLALLVRFAMQWARAPFRNPLGQFVVAVTDWMVRPVRRLVPGLFGVDMASLLLAWLWQVANQGVALGFSGVLAAVSPAPTLVVAALALLETAKLGLYLVIRRGAGVGGVFLGQSPCAAGRCLQHPDAPLAAAVPPHHSAGRWRGSVAAGAVAGAADRAVRDRRACATA